VPGPVSAFDPAAADPPPLPPPPKVLPGDFQGDCFDFAPAGTEARGAVLSLAVEEPRTRPGVEKASGSFFELEQMLPIFIFAV
jgi:hypothetical protein